MRVHCMSIFLTISLFTSFSVQFINGAEFNYPDYRRILHQPLFPADSATPPLPPPPPAPADLTDDQDLPFCHEFPTGPTTLDQSQQPPPLPVAINPPVHMHTFKSNTTKKVAVAILSAILTLGMLSAMVFYLYRNRLQHSRKLVGRMNEESRMPPSTFLRIEPSTVGLVNETNGAASGSPYRNPNSVKRYDHYKPSPDLHVPLPPLTKPRVNSPPPMSSSDDDPDESDDTRFSASKVTSISNNTSQLNQHRADINHVSSPVPHSKRTPPKSRFSASSPDARPVNVMIPSTKQSLPPSPPPPTTSLPLPYTPNRTKFSASPPSQERRRSIGIYKQQQFPKIPIPNPPPPPPPLSIPRNFGAPKTSTLPASKQMMRKFFLPSLEQEIRILDSKKSQNIAILLRALNVTREEVSEALLDGNPEGLGPELFETLVKMAPSKEEEMKLKDYKDEISKLGAAERFLKAILDIPFAFKRVEAMLYRANFNTEITYLRKSFQTLEEASEELKNSRLFLKLLEAVLKTGNRMNNGTNRGDAKAFKLDTLLKLVDIKGTDGKTTLLHFVVQEISRSEGGAAANPKVSESFDLKKQGLQVVAGLSKELANVKKAAGMDSDVLSSYVSKLELGLMKVEHVLQYKNQDKFFDSMKVFLEEAVDEISRVKAEERKALSLVKEVTEYFHGDAARNEAHPLRIFVVIRDFLSILDNVCKDVGRSFRISATAQLSVLISKYNLETDTSSDDDTM